MSESPASVYQETRLACPKLFACLLFRLLDQLMRLVRRLSRQTSANPSVNARSSFNGRES